MKETETTVEKNFLEQQKALAFADADSRLKLSIRIKSKCSPLMEEFFYLSGFSEEIFPFPYSNETMGDILTKYWFELFLENAKDCYLRKYPSINSSDLIIYYSWKLCSSSVAR